MNRVRAVLRAHPLPTGIVALVVGMACVAAPPLFEGPFGESLHEMAIAALMLAVMAVVGGITAVLPSARGMGFALRTSIPLLVVAAFPLVMTLVALVALPEALGLGELSYGELSPVLGLLVVASVSLSIAVAVFEEALFRGLLTSALVERLGRTSLGVTGAVVMASIVFGAVHVLPELVGGALTVAALIQALCKLLVSGGIGLLLAAIYLRTHNLWAAVLVHALNDLCSLLPAFVLAAGMLTPDGAADPASSSAVAGGLLSSIGGSEGLLSPDAASGMLLSVGSVLLAACYVPTVLVALGQLRRVAPQEGTIFSAVWQARRVDRERRASASPASPVRPHGPVGPVP